MAEKSKILVVGSLAYDHVMQFEGFFKDVMIPGNFSLSIPTHDRCVYYGGCSGNISYSLSVLGEKPSIITIVGKDFGQYKEWLVKNNIDSSHVYESEKLLTASAYIVTDKEENQITMFDPGAMHDVNTSQSVKDLPYGDIAYAIISPDKPESMVKYSAECKELGIPYIFDPSQQIPIFENGDLMRAIADADILIVNQYESELLCKKLDVSIEELEKMAGTFILTQGANGSQLLDSDGTRHFIKAVRPSKLLDPTGSGDAFRAGLLMGLRRGYSLKAACQCGALNATYSLESVGTQAHNFSWEDFTNRYKNSFGEELAVI